LIKSTIPAASVRRLKIEVRFDLRFRIDKDERPGHTSGVVGQIRSALQHGPAVDESTSTTQPL
jgi:hypothetical protein